MKEQRRGTLLVISGPSASGKTTIADAIRERLGAVPSVSATTRPRSSSEVDGREYTFVSEDEFQEMVDGGVFLEHACLYGTHRYGTPRAPVEKHLAAGELVLLEIDVQGGLQVREAMPEAYMIFIMPPSEEELERRIRARGRDDEAAIQRRLARARDEMELGRSSGVYDDHVVNDDLERAIDEACRLVEAHRDGVARA
jgi:guanylate kinase